jgi:hypothetical protein
MAVIVGCPNPVCGEKIEAPGGGTYTCPRCNQMFRVLGEPVPTAPYPPSSIPKPRPAPDGPRSSPRPKNAVPPQPEGALSSKIKAPRPASLPRPLAPKPPEPWEFSADAPGPASLSTSLSLKMAPTDLEGVIAWSDTPTSRELQLARRILFHSLWLAVFFVVLALLTGATNRAFVVVASLGYWVGWRWLLKRHDGMAERACRDHYLRMSETVAAHVARLTGGSGLHTDSYLLPDFTVVAVNAVRFTVAKLHRRDMSNLLTRDVIRAHRERRHVALIDQTTIDKGNKPTVEESGMKWGLVLLSWFIGARPPSLQQDEGGPTKITRTIRDVYVFVVTVETRSHVGNVTLFFDDDREGDEASNELVGRLNHAAQST